MIVAGVWTGVGFSNSKNWRTWFRTRIPKFWNRNGVGVWKCDSGHLWFAHVDTDRTGERRLNITPTV